ncbi:MAG: hypothetical protein U1E43_08530 [Rhodospirillales bacterium]
MEAALYRHPAVREVGVAGVPDGDDGQRVVAHVVRQEGAAVDEQELLAFVSADLGAGKLPRQIVFTDRLPCGLTGKIDRRALAQAPASGEPN